MSQDFKDALTVKVCKRKGDKTCCDNHRGICLLNSDCRKHFRLFAYSIYTYILEVTDPNRTASAMLNNLINTASGGARNFQLGWGGAKARTHGDWRARGTRAYTGVWGQSPQRGRAPSGGSGGEAPLKLKALSLFGGPLMRQICIILGICKVRNHIYFLRYIPTGLTRDHFSNPVGALV